MMQAKGRAESAERWLFLPSRWNAVNINQYRSKSRNIASDYRPGLSSRHRLRLRSVRLNAFVPELFPEVGDV